jgi:hypothetical protein
MSTDNGNGSGNGKFSSPHDNPTLGVDVITKFKDFSKFVDDVHEQALGDIGSMILHIHPRFIDVEKDDGNRFKITINMDKEDKND